MDHLPFSKPEIQGFLGFLIYLNLMPIFLLNSHEDREASVLHEDTVQWGVSGFSFHFTAEQY
jgi:hypothetical protein